MEEIKVTVVLTEGLYQELTEYAALLSAKPYRNGRTRAISLEHALIVAAMLYIEDYLYRQRQSLTAGGVSCSPPVWREGSGVGP